MARQNRAIHKLKKGIKMKQMITKKFILWVGGIDNHFDNLLDAEIALMEWKQKGYTDLIIERK